MTKLLDQSWKTWVRENVELGVPKKTIFNTLKNNDFSLEDIEKYVNIPDNKKNNQIQIRNIIEVETTLWGATKVPVKDDLLELYTIPNFLSKDICDELVLKIKGNCTKSRLSSNVNADSYIDDSFRTSSTCNLNDSDESVRDINDKMCEVLGYHHSRSETLQGQFYDVSQEFKAHTDTFAPNSDEWKIHCSKTGQRTWTFMMYLNETEEGGETKFNLITDPDGREIVFKPELGRAVIWNNLKEDGSQNRYSLHQGCPVVNGEKIILTKWFRQKHN